VEVICGNVCVRVERCAVEVICGNVCVCVCVYASPHTHTHTPNVMLCRTC
jgi:hypothetical protein